MGPLFAVNFLNGVAIKDMAEGTMANIMQESGEGDSKDGLVDDILVGVVVPLVVGPVHSGVEGLITVIVN
jgi:hypothetical protein